MFIIMYPGNEAKGHNEKQVWFLYFHTHHMSSEEQEKFFPKHLSTQLWQILKFVFKVQMRADYDFAC